MLIAPIHAFSADLSELDSVLTGFNSLVSSDSTIAVDKKPEKLARGTKVYISGENCYGMAQSIDLQHQTVEYFYRYSVDGFNYCGNASTTLQNIEPLLTDRSRVILEDGDEATVRSFFGDQKTVIVQRDKGSLERKDYSDLYSSIGHIEKYKVGKRVYDGRAQVAIIVGFRMVEWKKSTANYYGNSALVKYSNGTFQSWPLTDLAPVNE